MKSFFKTVLACMVGILLLWLLLFVFVLVVGLSSLSGSKAVVKSNSLLVLDLNQVRVEERIATDNPMFLFQGENSVRTIGLNDWEKVLKTAADDDRICGISLMPGNVSAAPATLEAMRDALKAFKAKGKFIYAYANTYSQTAYYLASVADTICLNPQGAVDIRGLASQVIYYKGLLDKYAVDMQVIRHGSYKSAAEPFISSRMSAENREQLSSCLTSIWDQLCEDIAASRNIQVKNIKSVADNLMLVSNGQVAQSTHFIDQLMYQDAYDQLLQDRVCQDTIRNLKINKTDYFNYLKTISASSAPYKVAVVYANGSINEEKGSSGVIGENIVSELAKLREKNEVRAVVLRVNSGGGSSMMSDRIWRELILLKEVKPVVVSMGDYAASGGYYISCAADYIVAEPATLTGSIGVFGLMPNVGKTMSDKLGLNVETVKTNTYADMGAVTRPLSTYEYNVIKQSVDMVYDTFVKRVADGRNLTVSYVDGIAQGRVWSGREALGIGLVDTLGGLDVAVAKAVEMAELARYSVIERPVTENFITTLTTSVMQTRQQRLEQQWKSSLLYPYYKAAKTLEGMKGIQAMLPYQLEWE